MDSDPARRPQRASADEAQVRVALVGAGRMGRVHLGALERSDRVSVAGIAEPVAATRAALERRGHRTYAGLDWLLGEPPSTTVDAVLIAAPSDQHLELVGSLARAGLPMLCEKPVGVHVEEAVQAAAAVRDHGVVFQVGYWRRFVPALRALRDRIAAGGLGEIALVACHQWDELPPSPEFREHSGGISVDMGVHEFDQVRWLTGREVSWVAAASAGTAPQDSNGDPDAAAILAQLSGGTAAAISLGRRFADGDCCWLEVFGTAGYERVEFMWGADGDAVFHAAVQAQLESFADAVKGHPQVGAGAPDAVAALRAAELAGEALAAGSSRELTAAVPLPS